MALLRLDESLQVFQNGEARKGPQVYGERWQVRGVSVSLDPIDFDSIPRIRLYRGFVGPSTVVWDSLTYGYFNPMNTIDLELQSQEPLILVCEDFMQKDEVMTTVHVMGDRYLGYAGYPETYWLGVR